MNRTDLFTEVIDAGILYETDAESLALTDSFEARLDEASERVTSKDDITRETAITDEHSRQILLSLFDDDPQFVVQTIAIIEQSDNIDASTALKLSLIIDQFRRGPPPNDGSPSGFVSVHGDQLSAIRSIYPKALVYIWREDCPSCNSICDILEQVAGEVSNNTGLFSIYGPDWAAHLQETVAVVGAPTLLFLADGSVDSRLQGNHYKSVIEAELETMGALE